MFWWFFFSNLGYKTSKKDGDDKDDCGEGYKTSKKDRDDCGEFSGTGMYMDNIKSGFLQSCQKIDAF